MSTTTCISTAPFAAATGTRTTDTRTTARPNAPAWRARALAAVTTALRAVRRGADDTPGDEVLDGVDELLARHRPHR